METVCSQDVSETIPKKMLAFMKYNKVLNTAKHFIHKIELDGVE
jgi:hypothetical protein